MKHKHLTRNNKQKTIASKIIYIAAIVEPLFVLPQIVQIFRLHNASSISILTWVGFNVLSAIWIWWAALNREKVIVIYQGLYVLFNSLVIIGACFYGGRWI